jgi:hypothetical protein
MESNTKPEIESEIKVSNEKGRGNFKVPIITYACVINVQFAEGAEGGQHKKLIQVRINDLS